MWAALSGADPSRVHTEGRMARVTLEDAREQVAALFSTRPRQVIFTSGATESINAASYGVLAGVRPGAVLMAPVEHSAVLESSRRWAVEALLLEVDRNGRVALHQRDRPGGQGLLHLRRVHPAAAVHR